MKMNGQVVDANFIVTLVIPRPGAAGFVFKAQPLTAEQHDFFKKVCPEPLPNMALFPGETVQRAIPNDVGYAQAKAAWEVLKSEHVFIASLAATDDLEWDTVIMDQPTTWGNAIAELLDAGFLNGEITQLFNSVASANGLDTKKIEQATKDFLAGQVQVNS